MMKDDMRHDDDVRQRVGHLEIEVGDLKAGQARLEVSSMSISADVQTIVAKLNQPTPPTNLTGWISTVVGTLAVIASFAWTNLQPIMADIADLERVNKVNTSDALKTAYSSGKHDQQTETNSEAIVDLFQRIDHLRIDVSAVQKQAAANEVRVDAK